MQRQFKNEFFTPKLQETLNTLGLDPNKETDFDGIMAASMVLDDALWSVYDEIDSYSAIPTSMDQLDAEIEKRSGLKSVLETYTRTTLEKLGSTSETPDLSMMILARKKPNYELVKSLLEK